MTLGFVDIQSVVVLAHGHSFRFRKEIEENNDNQETSPTRYHHSDKSEIREGLSYRK